MAAERDFDMRLANATQPANKHFDIDALKSDTVDFLKLSRGVWVGADGDVKIKVGGLVLLYSGARAGTIIPVMAERVDATGTTATGLVGMY